MNDSKQNKGSGKPVKPYKDFPLHAHKAGQWVKTINGKRFYFGQWSNWKAALAKYEAEREFIRAHGVRPNSVAEITGGLTVADLCNHYLISKQSSVEAGRLSPRSFNDYKRTCEHLISVVTRDRTAATLTARDFTLVRQSLDKRLSNRSAGNEIGRIRMIFKFGVDQGLLDRLPIYGQDFSKPSRDVIRRDRQKQPKKLFSPAELQSIIKTAGQPLKAMILLGINSGMGNSDVARIEHRHIDFKTGWIDYPRWKTAVERRFPMWPETIKALKEAIKLRPEGGEPDQVFCTNKNRTNKGLSWFKEESSTNPITQAFRKVLDKLDIYRKGVNFYSLRHSFETYAGDENSDQVAIDAVMGHADESMSANYRESVADKRLKAVVDAVRNKVFAKQELNSGN